MDDDSTSSSSQQQQNQHQNQQQRGDGSRRASVHSVHSTTSSTTSIGLGAPVMDRAVPDVPLPPFMPLPRDEGFIDCRPPSARAQQEEQQQRERPPLDELVNYWPYPLLPAAREFILERPDPAQRSYAHRLPNPERIRRHFRDGGSLSTEDALWILGAAQMVLLEEPNVLELRSPVTVCGDTHGQFFDLLTLLELGGSPVFGEDDDESGSNNDDDDSSRQQHQQQPTQYLFLGDYVDRGCFSTEIALLLLSYKLRCPQRVWLLRGNHECRHLTAYFNFKTECVKKYNETVYDAFMNCFDALPLAARVDGKFLCVHGGIGPDIRSVEDIALIQRVMEPPPRGPMCDLLWADPMEPDEEAGAPGARFLYNDIRSCSYSFSYKATLEFLKANNLLALIRAHESQFEGYRMFQKVPETGMPSVICVFSAPNYCEYNNKAAILQIADHTVRIRQFAAVEHPYVLQNFLNAFSWSLPFLLDKMQHVAAEVSALSTEPMAPVPIQQRRQSASEAAESSVGSSSSVVSSSAPKTTAGSVPSTVDADNNGGSSSPAEADDKSNAAAHPLLHALRAKGGAQAMAREVLAAHHAALRDKSENASLDGLLCLAMKLRSFLLLPRFLRRRGRIVLIKVRAVVWFLRRPQRKAAAEKETAVEFGVRRVDPNEGVEMED